MIHAIFIFNTFGHARLIKFYEPCAEARQKEILATVYEQVRKRKLTDCHFVENGPLNLSATGNDKLLLLYRQYATLYIAFVVDDSENMLAILDLIQIFVEALDRCFESICELDIIFNMNKIHYILNEIIIGGLVVETDLDLIIANYKDQKKLESKERNFETRAKKKMSDIRNTIDSNLSELRRNARKRMTALKKATAEGTANNLNKQ